MNAGARFAFLMGIRRDAARKLWNARHVAMLREFTDKAGTNWLVWDVYPSPRGAESLRADFAPSAFPQRELADGWLCFESATEKRRFTPIPPGWEVWEPAALEDICGRAGYVSPPGFRDKSRDPDSPRH